MPRALRSIRQEGCQGRGENDKRIFKPAGVLIVGGANMTLESLLVAVPIQATEEHVGIVHRTDHTPHVWTVKVGRVIWACATACQTTLAGGTPWPKRRRCIVFVRSGRRSESTLQVSRTCDAVRLGPYAPLYRRRKVLEHQVI